ncbi:MAG: DUF2267 domain-containing protein [Ferruginibacter sp.]
MPFEFEKHAVKGNEFVTLVAEELEVSPGIAGSIIRAVFHALRNRLTHEESFKLLALLPMALKGVYLDGWKYDKDFNQISHMEDFLDEVRLEDGGMAGFEFADNSKAKTAIACIFRTLNYFVSYEEMNEILNVLSAELKKFIKESISGDETVL